MSINEEEYLTTKNNFRCDNYGIPFQLIQNHSLPNDGTEKTPQ
jgi:hypothetical protein